MKYLHVFYLVVLIQSGCCKVRDLRDAPSVFEFIKKSLAATLQELENLDQQNELEKQTLHLAGDMFVNDAIVCLEYVSHAIINNTQNNNYGKDLQAFSDFTREYVQWLQDNLGKDNDNLQENLKNAILKYAPVPDTVLQLFKNLKESTSNQDLATNLLMAAEEHTFYFFSKLYVDIKNKKSSNNDLSKKIQVMVLETFKNLDQISGNSYKTNELMIHLYQLKHLVHIHLAKVKTATNQNSFKKVTKRLGNVENEIHEKIQTPLTFVALKNFYKNILGEISKIVEDLDTNSSQMYDVRSVMVDTLGVLAYFKNEFEILAKTM